MTSPNETPRVGHENENSTVTEWLKNFGAAVLALSVGALATVEIIDAVVNGPVNLP